MFLKALCSRVIKKSGWLSGECVGLMTWWLRVRDSVEAYKYINRLIYIQAYMITIKIIKVSK